MKPKNVQENIFSPIYSLGLNNGLFDINAVEDETMFKYM